LLEIAVATDRKVLPCGCVTFRDAQLPDFRFLKYCEAHAKEHGTDLQTQTYLEGNTPKYEVTEGDIERVLTYLRNGRVATIDEISDALGLRQITIARSLQKIGDRGILDHTSDKDRRYFLRI